MGIDKHIYPSVHKGIVRASLRTLELDRHPAADWFTAADLETLVAEAAAPDQIGDRQQGRGLHYYCAVKPDGSKLPQHPFLQGWCNGRNEPAPSPLTMLDGEYRTALALERAGQREAAMRCLSRAMHMLADLCCPPHTCGLTYFSRYAMMHKRYELRAAELFWDSPARELDEARAAAVWAEKATGSVPYDRYQKLLLGTVPLENGQWQGGTFAAICNRLAASGAAELPAVLGEDMLALDDSVNRRLLVSIANCTALLAAFVQDCRDQSPQIWQEQCPYWLKAIGTAFVVSEEPLYLRFTETGAVTLSTQEGRTLSVSRMGQVLLTDSESNVRNAFRLGREPLLTLSLDSDRSRVLTLIRGRLYCSRRLGMLQSEQMMLQSSFALLKKQPEHAKALLR